MTKFKSKKFSIFSLSLSFFLPKSLEKHINHFTIKRRENFIEVSGCNCSLLTIYCNFERKLFIESSSELFLVFRNSSRTVIWKVFIDSHTKLTQFLIFPSFPSHSWWSKNISLVSLASTTSSCVMRSDCLEQIEK